MEGDETTQAVVTGEAAKAAEKPKVAVPNLTNKKRFDCGNGRFALVRCAGEVTLGEIEAQYAAGVQGSQRRFVNRCAQWGIVSLEGEWGVGPDGKPWTKITGPLGKVYPVELIETISANVIGEIAAYVNVGAYLDEVQGKD